MKAAKRGTVKRPAAKGSAKGAQRGGWRQEQQRLNQMARKAAGK